MAQRATWHPAGLLGSRRGGGPSGDSKGCARCIACRAGNAGAYLSIGDRCDRTQLGRSFGRAQPAHARCDPRCHSCRYRRRLAGLRHLRPASPSDRRGTRSAGGESRGLKPTVAQSPSTVRMFLSNATRADGSRVVRLAEGTIGAVAGAGKLIVGDGEEAIDLSRSCCCPHLRSRTLTSTRH